MSAWFIGADVDSYPDHLPLTSLEHVADTLHPVSQQTAVFPASLLVVFWYPARLLSRPRTGIPSMAASASLPKLLYDTCVICKDSLPSAK